MARVPPAPPLICTNCGDEIVIAAAFLPSGALCADCGPEAGPVLQAPTNENPEKGLSDELSPVSAPAEVASTGCNFAGCLRVKDHRSFHTTVEAVAEREDTREALAVLDPRAFHPEPGAQGRAIEVEEWIFHAARAVATPTELFVAEIRSRSTTQPELNDPFDRYFVVVLEWCRHDSAPTQRDIGPAFGYVNDRHAALRAATEFARAEAKRLHAFPPYGYKPAREIPTI